MFFFQLFLDVADKNAEKQQKFGASWSKPIRQVSLTYDSPKPIDTLGADATDTTEDEPPKNAVPARNSWTVGIVDSESEAEILPDSEEENQEDEQSESDENEFLDDEAEEAGEDYVSGDSMDEDERREVEGT